VLGHFLVLLAGLALLVPAADHFVTGAARIGLRLNVSAVVVGAVIIGFGTSAPELLITVLGAAAGATEIAAGNIVGSNVANLALVAAGCALILPLQVSSRTLRRELPLSAVAVLLFALALQGGLTRGEGIVLVVALGGAVTWIVRSTSPDEDVLGPEASEVAGECHDLRLESLRTGLGLLGTLAGAQLVVMGAQDIAADLGVREGFVGLTLVAVGTSLPELVTGVQAARRGHSDLIVGNVLGSNLFNSLAAGGLLAIIAPGPLEDPDLAGLAAGVMVVTTVGACVLFATGRRLVRWEAVLLLVAYAAILPLLSR
jgi:cation:H+ antiporter